MTMSFRQFSVYGPVIAYLEKVLDAVNLQIAQNPQIGIQIEHKEWTDALEESEVEEMVTIEDTCRIDLAISLRGRSYVVRCTMFLKCSEGCIYVDGYQLTSVLKTFEPRLVPEI